MNRKIKLIEISQMPSFSLPSKEPMILSDEYQKRIDDTIKAGRELNYDLIIIYADREHFANMAYLTNHDPRFEEALFVLPTNGKKPIMVLGNEGIGHSTNVPVEIERRLFQGFSLLGQRRNLAPKLASVLTECGIKKGMRIGLVGWKFVDSNEYEDPLHWFDVPYYIVDTLFQLVGKQNLVENATKIFLGLSAGIRNINTVDQLAVFEFAASYCSHSVKNMIENLQPGITEYEAVQTMQLNGMPLVAHIMFTSGPRTQIPLVGPSDRIIRLQDPYFVALSLRGSLVARAGFMVTKASELREENRDYIEELVKPYFSTVVDWYENIRIGITGGELQSVVDLSLNENNLDIALNPGHLIHLEEWSNTPIFPTSPHKLKSGMLLQCDIIPVSEPRLHTTNIEDTIALADQDLRQAFELAYPDAWNRIVTRRKFMREQLGINLSDDVLPFSNLPAILQPFVLNPNLILSSV